MTTVVEYSEAYGGRTYVREQGTRNNPIDEERREGRVAHGLKNGGSRRFRRAVSMDLNEFTGSSERGIGVC